MDDGETRLSATETRAGSTEHVVRYVLLISLTLVVLLFGLLLVWH